MGRNGSGKSTLLGQLAGRPRADSRAGWAWRGDRSRRARPAGLVPRVGLVPQDAGLLLYGDSVAAECDGADHDTGLEPGDDGRRARAASCPASTRDRHPRDLSEGQRLALALAVVLAPRRRRLLLFDEPTRGLDYPGKARLVGLVRPSWPPTDHAVVMATHDVELVAQVAARAVVLAEGEVVADGPARDVVCHSPVFAPQVAKVLAPEPWLTVRRGPVGALEAESVRG